MPNSRPQGSLDQYWQQIGKYRFALKEKYVAAIGYLINYRRKNNSGAFCSSCKKSVSCLSMLDTRLRSLKGKPIDGVVGTKPLASCYNTHLETRGGDVFNPNKHCIMDMRGVAMVIHWCKNPNRCPRVWKTSTKGRVLTLVSFIANQLDFSLSLFGPWRSKSNNNDKLLWSFSALFVLFCLFVRFVQFVILQFYSFTSLLKR